MTTYISSISDLISFLIKARNQGYDVVIFEKGGLVQADAPTKNRKRYNLVFGMAPDVFKTEDVSPLIFGKSIPFCGLIIHKEDEEKINVQKSKENSKRIAKEK